MHSTCYDEGGNLDASIKRVCHCSAMRSQATHKEPEEAVDHIALRGVRVLRWSFDVLAGFKTGVIDEHKCESGVYRLGELAGLQSEAANETGT